MTVGLRLYKEKMEGFLAAVEKQSAGEDAAAQPLFNTQQKDGLIRMLQRWSKADPKNREVRRLLRRLSDPRFDQESGDILERLTFGPLTNLAGERPAKRSVHNPAEKEGP